MSTKIDTITSKVLKQIKPNKAEMLKQVDVFLKQLEAELKKQKIKAKVILGGSIAKDTFLKGAHDADIFVKFDMKYKDEDISKELKKALKSFKSELVHGSRDYFFIESDLHYEIVPVLDIKDVENPPNVTDLSPMHVEWVQKNNKYTDEIRLAKQFCKAAHVYGAESFRQGFSGHVLDILVIHYKGFNNLLKASLKWKNKEVIDPENVHKGKALKNLNRSRIDSPIIVIDPVLSERNAAAALGEEKLKAFQDKAKDFLKTPDESFFKIKKLTLSDLKKTAGKNKLITIEVNPVTGKTDVIGAKIFKAFQLMRNQLQFHDFDLLDSDWEWDEKGKALLWFILDPNNLTPVAKRIGPPIDVKKNVEEFKIKHKKTFTENNRICTYIKRKYTNAENLIDNLIKDPILKEKAKKFTRK